MKLLDYIRGTRKGKEAHRLQKEAMRDPFLADAMDGYDSVGENQEYQIEILRRRIRGKAKGKRNHAVVWSVAASLLIGVCLSSYFIYQKNRLPEDVFMTLEALQRDTVLQVVSQTPQLPLAKSAHPEEKGKLAGIVRGDSVKVFASRERQLSKAAPAKMREEIADEAGMSVMADVVEVDSVAAKPVSTALSDATNNGIAKQLSGMVSGIKVNGVKGRVIDIFHLSSRYERLLPEALFRLPDLLSAE